MTQAEISAFEIRQSELVATAGTTARFLAQHSGPEARIALLAENSTDFVVARMAATAADRVLVPINPKLTASEIGYVLTDSGATVLLCTDELRALAQSASDALPAGPRVLTIGDAVAEPAMAMAEATGATLIYTSGTTGYPKGCLRGERHEAARARELISTYGLCADDVHLIACPLAHSAPGIFLRAGLQVGARTFVLPRFRAESFLAAVQATSASFFFLVPTQYERLLALPEQTRAAFDLGSIRCALVAGAPIAPATKRRLIEWLGPDRLWEFYGSSETGTVSVLPPADQLRKTGSVGRPPPGVEIRIVSEDGREVEDYEVGEIFVRSETLMSGYLKDGVLRRPEERGGFISVGDLGKRDPEGYLYLIDRKHDTIISGGVNVYPAEVERVLASHPEVAGAVAFGLQDPDWGQIVCAAVAHINAAGSALDQQAAVDGLRDFLRQRLAAFKVPKAIAIITLDELPIGASGKPLRRRARAEFAERMLRPRSSTVSTVTKA